MAVRGPREVWDKLKPEFSNIHNHISDDTKERITSFERMLLKRAIRNYKPPKLLNPSNIIRSEFKQTFFKIKEKAKQIKKVRHASNKDVREFYRMPHWDNSLPRAQRIRSLRNNEYLNIDQELETSMTTGHYKVKRFYKDESNQTSAEQ